MMEPMVSTMTQTTAISGLLIGLFTGILGSGLFFAGLAWGMRVALRSNRPGSILLLSFMLRTGLLLGLGWWLVLFAHPLWSLGAYLLTFFVVRTIAIHRARRVARNPD